MINKNLLSEVLSTCKEEQIEANGIKYLNEKFTRAEIQRIGAMCIGTVVGIGTVADFVRYRMEIKKPLKTTRPIKSMVKKLIDADANGYDINQIIKNDWKL